MDWFEVEPGKCSEILNHFISKFKIQKLINNVPKNDAKISDSSNKKEHIIENVFVKVEKVKEYIRPHEHLLPKKLYNQLPRGLFERSVCNDNRVFPTGFFDLWGVDQNNDLWLFELKGKDNQAAGILSELFFYANYASQVFQSLTSN
jgi:hypothetical protein